MTERGQGQTERSKMRSRPNEKIQQSEKQDHKKPTTKRTFPIVRSEQLLGDLLPERHRRHERRLGLLDRGDPPDEVHLVGLPELGLLPDLVTKVQTEEDGDVDVGGEEVGGVEGEEDGESVDEDAECRPEHSPDGEIGLQAGVVDELCAVDALALETGVEAEVCQVDGHPCEKSSDGCQVHEPCEDRSRVALDVHVSEDREH